MIGNVAQVNREVSKELSLDESLVKSVNAFFWKSTRRAISSALYTSIRVNNLGTYVISRRKLQAHIRKIIKEIRYFRSSNKVYKLKSREEYISEHIGELKKLLERRNDIAKIYREREVKIKKKRDAKKSVGE